MVATGRLKPNGELEPLDIVLNLPLAVKKPAALRFWNYNGTCLSKGIREVEVRCGRNLIWTGIIPRGTGGELSPTTVALDSTGQLDEGSEAPFLCHDTSSSCAVDLLAERSYPADQELMQSLRALDDFRASQGRRFFSGSLAPQKTDGNTQAPVIIDGLSIPIRTFGEDVEAPDRSDFMGSSLVRCDASMSLTIPTLPRGRRLVFNCVSTWGDENFVGLAGIEIFDGHGLPIILKDAKRQVSADPASINVLPEYNNDPRTADKLFDQVNLTRDDLHVWLAPFFPDRAHTVTVDLERESQLSMVRIWNYNKSRGHSSRGVRDMEIFLDDSPIFLGEIRQAPGLLTPDQAEHILFTQDASVLDAIEEHDWLPAHLPLDDLDTVDARGIERPHSADRGAGEDGRPMTQAGGELCARGVVCSTITLVLHSTWGDGYYIGLTALEVLDPTLTPIPLGPDHLWASPSDLNDLEGVTDDPRTIDKLFDGVTCTTDDAHMWLAPLMPKPHQNVINLNLGSRQEVSGFHVWNYNKSVEDTSRGLKEFSVFVDDEYLATFLCRKAPGHVNFEFKQVVLLNQPPDAQRVGGSRPPLVPRSLERRRPSPSPHAGRQQST